MGVSNSFQIFESKRGVGGTAQPKGVGGTALRSARKKGRRILVAWSVAIPTSSCQADLCGVFLSHSVDLRRGRAASRWPHSTAATGYGTLFRILSTSESGSGAVAVPYAQTSGNAHSHRAFTAETPVLAGARLTLTHTWQAAAWPQAQCWAICLVRLCSLLGCQQVCVDSSRRRN